MKPIQRSPWNNNYLFLTFALRSLYLVRRKTFPFAAQTIYLHRFNALNASRGIIAIFITWNRIKWGIIWKFIATTNVSIKINTFGADNREFMRKLDENWMKMKQEKRLKCKYYCVSNVYTIDCWLLSVEWKKKKLTQFRGVQCAAEHCA